MTKEKAVAGSPIIYASDQPDEEVIALAAAIDRYKRTQNRQYPHTLELLAVIHSLGYRVIEDPTPLPRYVTARRPDVTAK